MGTGQGMATGTDRGLTIKEAAVRLGITDVAVRKRLVRGKLPGYKDETGQWFVHLPDDLPEPSPSKTADTLLSSAQGTAHVIARLEDEVSYLREELRRERESRDEELRRKDVLLADFSHYLAEITQRMPELPATTPSPDVHANGSAPRPWWKLW